MSNAFIPDQLHHVSKKELLEFAQTTHEENVKLSRIKREWEQVFSPVEEYCKKNKLTALGQSYTKYLVDSHDSLRTQLAKANERVKELEAQLKRLIDYEADQALLPEASSQGTRQLVNDIKNDATDVGGCYEVSCGLLDSLFEHYTDKGASKLLNKFAIEKKSEAFNAVKNEIKTVGGLELCDVVEFIDEQLEQLRKEQSQC